MPTYDYECTNCNHKITDIYQSIKSDALIECDKCKKDTLIRIIYCPYISVKGEAKTIGQLAERNTKKMGKTLVQEKSLKDKESKKQALSEAKKEMNSKIGSMTEAQKKRYIEDGKI